MFPPFAPRFRLQSGTLTPTDAFLHPPLPKIRQKAEFENGKPGLNNGKWESDNGKREKNRISRKKYTEKFGGTGNYSDLCSVKSTPVEK